MFGLVGTLAPYRLGRLCISLIVGGLGLAGCNGTGGTEDAVEPLVVPAAAVTASAVDTRCDCAPGNMVDGDRSTRWAGRGDGAHATFDLGDLYELQAVDVAWHKGDERVATFDLLAAEAANGPWSHVRSGVVSSGQTLGHERVALGSTQARHIRIVGHGNSSGNGWNSITEVRIIASPVAELPPPRFVPTGGVYQAPQSVRISSPVAGARLRYTMDGSDPTPVMGTRYSGPVSIEESVGLKAIAYRAGRTSSAVAVSNYVIDDGGSRTHNPDAPPSDNFDLSRWKLTLPDASEVSVDALNNGFSDEEAFYTDPVSGGMVFRSPNHAGTTANSSYSRSELREMLDPKAGAKDLSNNWVLGTSSFSAKRAAGAVDGTMRATLTVDRVSTSGAAKKVGRVIVGQIHGPSSEVIRLYFHKRPSDSKGAVYLGHDTPANENSYQSIIGGPKQLDPENGIALGARWHYQIQVVGRELSVQVRPEGGRTVERSLPIEKGYEDQYLYFKAGVYNQNNTGHGSDYVQATFHELTQQHP